jgi:tRNA modification GTPase
LLRTLVRIRKQTDGEDKKLIILVNKIDNDLHGLLKEFKNNLNVMPGESLLFISAKTGEGIDSLKEQLRRSVDNRRLTSENVIITNIRHYEALLQVADSLKRVKSGLENKTQEDLIAIDIRQAIHYLGEITGEITTDEILGNIFKNFCIGK